MNSKINESVAIGISFHTVNLGYTIQTSIFLIKISLFDLNKTVTTFSSF